MKKLGLLLASVLLSISSFAQNKWNVDNLHSSLNFAVKHLGISFVDGRFDNYQGTFTGNPNELSSGVFNFVIETNSINTGVEMRDNHLKSSDFFNTDAFSQIVFKSTTLKKINANEYDLNGDITIKGITKPITFRLHKSEVLKDDGNGNTKVGFQGKATLNRFDFGIDYDPSAVGIANQIDLLVNLQFTQEK